jgi:hypothetical protein
MKMKRILFFIISVLMFVSCAKNDFDYNVTEAVTAQYNTAFVKTFGEPASNQACGFNDRVLPASFGATTRAANTNGNEWATNGYNVPGPITEAERQAVLNVFNQKGEASYTSLIDLDCFFVQQVYKGVATYKNHDNQTVTGSEHMDWLCTVTNKHVEVVCYWPYEESVTIGEYYDDHINNFNNGKCDAWDGIMLMVNTNSNKFGFKSSEDNGHVFYNFRMEQINGNYYVGFDFEAAGANPNEQVDRDYIYNDWIVKIVPGKGTTPSVERVRIMCEDLGATTSDFDYNDIVFDIRFIKVGEKYKADIIVQAAGGTLPLTIGGLEVHSLFGVSTGTMVNTYHGKHNEKEPISLTIELNGTYSNAWEAINNLPIIVKNPNGEVIQLTVNPGSPAEMIAVPVTTEWSDERVPIQNSYPAFVDWIRDSSVKWWTEE